MIYADVLYYDALSLCLGLGVKKANDALGPITAEHLARIIRIEHRALARLERRAAAWRRVHALNGLLPDDSTVQQRARLPVGNVKLGDGRLLRWVGPWTNGSRHLHEPSMLSVIASIDEHPRHGPLLHVSLAHLTALPSWRDVKLVREAFFPMDVDCMMVLPRAEDYVNLHELCFHIWECPDVWRLQ